MAERREDISVRISADYAKALADMQRFTGSAGRAFDELPRVVQGVGNSVDRLNERIERMGRNDGPDQLRRRLGQVNSEASALSKTFDDIATGGAAIGAIMAGWEAGKMVIKPPLEQMMSYESKLADLTNLANADKDIAGRLAAMPGLNKKIQDTIRGTGGDRDSGLDVYSKILDAGGYSQEQADVMAPTIMRGATATGAEALDIAGVGIAAIKNMDFKDIDLPKIIGMSIESANLGGFGLKDMAKSLPGQMAIASETLGMKGETGYAQLLTANQASVLTSRDPNEAANNVVNLLGKMTAPDTAKDFQKHGIDLIKEMQDTSAKGGNPFVSLLQSVDKVMAGNKEYQALDKKLGNTKDDGEQTKILEQQLALIRGAGIGTVFQDVQARSALFGLMKMGEAEIERQSKLVPKDPTKAFDTNFGVKSASLEFSNQQRLNVELNAQTEALSTLNPALKAYNKWITEFGQSHPALLTALEGGKLGTKALAASAGAAAFVLGLLTKSATSASGALSGIGGSPGAGGPGGSGGGAGGAGGAGLAAIGKNAKNLLKVSGPVNAALAAYESYGIYNNEKLTALEKKIGYSGAAGGALGGTLGGAAAGAVAGSIVPGIGTALGMLIGGALGAWGGQKAGTAVGESMFGESNGPSPEKVQKAWHEESKLNPLEARLQMHTAFNTIAPPISLPAVTNAEPGTAIQKQLANPGANNEALQRALVQGLKPLPIEMKVKTEVVLTDSGKLQVVGQKIAGSNVRLDTGPMMVH